jgi:hypothetical protein
MMSEKKRDCFSIDLLFQARLNSDKMATPFSTSICSLCVRWYW